MKREFLWIAVAAAIIGCGGSAPTDSLSGNTGSTGLNGSTGLGSATGGGITGTNGGIGSEPQPGVLAIDLVFTDLDGTNVNPEPITEVNNASLLGYREEGANVWIIQTDGDDGPRRAFELDIPIELRAGASYRYTGDDSISRPLADYVELPGAHAPIRIWWAQSGTVRVVSLTEEQVVLQFDDFRFAPSLDGTTEAVGSFSISGTVHLRNYDPNA